MSEMGEETKFDRFENTEQPRHERNRRRTEKPAANQRLYGCRGTIPIDKSSRLSSF